MAIVARNAQRLDAAEARLTEAGVHTKAFPCDLGDPEAVRVLIGDVRSALGPITVLHWNAFVSGAEDLTTATTEQLRAVLDVSLYGFVAAVQESLPDLRRVRGAVLVTGGGFAFGASGRTPPPGCR